MMQRSYSQMAARHDHSSSPLFVRQDSFESALNPSPSPLPPPPPPPPPPHPHILLPPIHSHFPRDGLDFRRPVSTMSAEPTNTVIDLTSDDESPYPTPQPDPPPAATAPPTPAPAPAPSRLPRYDREIIDLSVDTSPLRPRISARQSPAARHSSPDVEFVSSRPLSRADHRANQVPPFLNPEPRRPVMDLTVENDNDDDVITLGSRGGVNLLRPHGVPQRPALGFLAHMVREAGRAGFRRTLAMGPQIWHDDDNGPGLLTRLHVGAALPAMNYETVAFDLGVGDEPPRQPTPKYSPPPAAPQGFTRDPAEQDTLVCPNCQDELAVGETDEKRQVWVVKSCGHVYCGTCTNNRQYKRPKNAKGKGKRRADDPSLPEPFAFCRATGCGQTRVSHKGDVMQIFL